MGVNTKLYSVIFHDRILNPILLHIKGYNVESNDDNNETEIQYTCNDFLPKAEIALPMKIKKL